MSEPDLVLYLAVPSACTLNLAQALASMRPQLLARGVGFLGDAALTGSRTAGDAFAAERRAASGGPVILCTDATLGATNLGPGDSPRLRPGAAAAVADLVRALGARHVLVVMHSRRQDRLMEQAYLRELLAGRWHLFDKQFPDAAAPVLDFGDLLERVSTVRGVVRTVLRPIELAGAGRAAFVDDFLDAVGAKGTLDVGTLGRWVEAPVCSPRGMNVALALNPHLETPDEQELVRAFVVRRFPGDPQVNSFLDDAERARILDAHAETNQQAFDKHMPGLPVDAYSSDAATAKLGSVLDPIADPTPPAPVSPDRRAARSPFAGRTVSIGRARRS